MDYLKDDPYLQKSPIEAVENKIQQMTSLDPKWAPAGESSGAGKETKPPMKNMFLEFTTNSAFYNSRKQQATKTSVLAPHGNYESFDGKTMPHLTVAENNNVFAIEVQNANGETEVGNITLPLDLNYRIVSGNGLRFYDGSEGGSPPEEQNIYTSVRVEAYSPTSIGVMTVTGAPIQANATALDDFIKEAQDMGLNPVVKEYTVGTGSLGPSVAGMRQIRTVTVDIVTPIDWSNVTAFNQQFMTPTQAAEVNAAFPTITQKDFDYPVVGIMTDANLNYNQAGVFLASYAKAKNYEGDLARAAKELREEYKQHNNSQPADKKVTFEEFILSKFTQE